MPDDKSLAQSKELLQALPRSCLTPAVQEDQIQAERPLKQKLENTRSTNTARPAASSLDADQPRRKKSTSY